MKAWIAVAVMLIAAGLLLSAALKDDTSSDKSYGAFDVCTQFVKRGLKSPATAKFRNYYEKDGEVRVTLGQGGAYTVASTVDSENGFGALIRSTFVCVVAPVGGSDWRLVDLDIT